MNLLYPTIIVILIAVIMLILWLVWRSSSNDSNTKQQLNQTCSATSQCATGLVCDKSTGAVTGVCKVANGGVCSAGPQCSTGSTCQNGVCKALPSGKCPCGEGYTCVNGNCKVAAGNNCKTDEECATGMCRCGICVVTDPKMVHPSKRMIEVLISMLECDKCERESKECSCSDGHAKESSSDAKPHVYSTSSELTDSSDSYESRQTKCHESNYESHRSECKYLSSGCSNDCSCYKSSSYKFSN